MTLYHFKITIFIIYLQSVICVNKDVIATKCLVQSFGIFFLLGELYRVRYTTFRSINWLYIPIPYTITLRRYKTSANLHHSSRKLSETWCLCWLIKSYLTWLGENSSLGRLHCSNLSVDLSSTVVVTIRHDWRNLKKRVIVCIKRCVTLPSKQTCLPDNFHSGTTPYFW